MEKHDEKGNQTDEQQAKKPCEDCEKRAQEGYIGWRIAPHPDDADHVLTAKEEAMARYPGFAVGCILAELSATRRELRRSCAMLTSIYVVLVVLIFALLMSQKD